MRVAFVVARSLNNVIGCDGKLPWDIPSELKHFREITRGKPVIMGRNTWESLPKKPLPNRLNIVLSHELADELPGAIVATSPEQALEFASTAAEKAGADEICVIGGQSVFSAMWSFADRIYETVVETEILDGDTYFCIDDRDEWETVFKSGPIRLDGDEFCYTVKTVDRRHCQLAMVG